MYAGERFNSISHLVGDVLAIMGLGALLTVAIQSGNIWMIASFSIYGLTLVLLYTASTLYHSFRSPELKKIFQKIDHSSIYILIAGSYTPFTLLPLRDTCGPYILISVWSLAVIGILIDNLSARRRELLQVGIYLFMGWFVLIEFDQMVKDVPAEGIFWVAMGGIAYTTGIVFYALDRRFRHFHGIWHLFVITGSICHFIAIIGYVR